jgi:hypothetical protein
VRAGSGLAIFGEAAQSFCSREEEDSRRTCMVCRQVREWQMTGLPDTLSRVLIHIADRASEEKYRDGRCQAAGESGNFQFVELDPWLTRRSKSDELAGAAART